MTQRTAHVDTFARDRLPPRELWPAMDASALGYPPRLNAAVELVTCAVREGRGERTAVVSPTERLTYRELDERSNRIARVLVEDLGVVPGGRVLLRGPNCPTMAAAWLGVLKAGAIDVCTMPQLRRRELAFKATKARIALALCDARMCEELEGAREDAPVLERIVRFGLGEELDRLAAGKPADFAAVDTAADDVAIIAFTSGTTGTAKGTVHTHADLIAICDLFPRHCLRATEDDLFCGSPPLAFTFGLGGLLLFPLRVGAAGLLLEQAAPPALIEAIARHRATVCFTAPTAYRAMAELAPDHDVSSLRKCVSAGEHLPLATFERWRRATGLTIIDGIGATEMLHIFISAAEDEVRAGSTGRAVPGYEARIVDDAGGVLPPGTIGHLAVRGPTGCRYLDDDERQRAYVRDGWNYPGDAYMMDEAGYFWYQSRTDDLIVSSGYKIAGPEVENVLLEHPSVQECGVVGLPDAERGQVVTAYVVLRPGAAGGDALAHELQEFVKRHIAPYKYPRRVEFVERLPRTETGKLQRFRLRRPDEAPAPSAAP
jgi:2-aminobenzoate-CoA ligase